MVIFKTLYEWTRPVYVCPVVWKTSLYHWFCIHPTKAQLNLIHHGYSINHIGSSQTSASMLTSHSNFRTFKIQTTENAHKVQGTGMWLNSLLFMSSFLSWAGEWCFSLSNHQGLCFTAMLSQMCWEWLGHHTSQPLQNPRTHVIWSHRYVHTWHHELVLELLRSYTRIDFASLNPLLDVQGHTSIQYISGSYKIKLFIGLLLKTWHF